MQIVKFKLAPLTAIIILTTVISINSGISLLMRNYVISSSGTISYGPVETLPLHTDGKYVKDSNGNIVFLRGAWKEEYTDDCTGWWTPAGQKGNGYGHWDETAVRTHMQAMRDDWSFNTFATLIWADWWINNSMTTLGGAPADKPYRESIKDTLSIAQEYGLYVQLRLWSISFSEGRVLLPYNSGEAYCSKLWTKQDFIDFWASVATELKGYPNVILCLFDEPATAFQDDWFSTATDAINAMRNVGFDGLIVKHWFFCGSCLWMEKWINQGRPTYNILFSNHIYRHHGTFEDSPNSPTDYDYIKNQLGDNVGSHRAYKYIIDTYNIPVQVTIGSYDADTSHNTDDDEYIAFINTLQVLNEWEIGYWAYQWFKSDTIFSLQQDTVCVQPPNRVGQALIDAIAAGKT